MCNPWLGLVKFCCKSQLEVDFESRDRLVLFALE